MSMIDCTLLQLHATGKWDNFIFKEGLQVLLSFSLIKLVSSKGVYSMHPLAHGWGRDKMTSEDRQKYCLMPYIMLASPPLGHHHDQAHDGHHITTIAITMWGWFFICFTHNTHYVMTITFSCLQM